MDDGGNRGKEAHAELVRKLIKVGDVLTHTRCMGIIEEHVYVGDIDQRWLEGRPTIDTAKFSGCRKVVDDISPASVTHINRVPVGCYEMCLVIDRPYAKTTRLP